MPEERSKRRIACGFFVSFLLYSVYIFGGLAVILLRYPPVASHDETLCRMNLKLYAGIGSLAALRSLVGLCRSYHMYLQKQRPFPTEQELWMRVAVKVYVVIHGLTLFVIFRKSQDLHITKAVAYRLWLFFSITLWVNVVSVSLMPFTFEESLQQARRIQQEEQQNTRVQAATGRPLSVFYKMYHVQNDFRKDPADGLGLGEEDEEMPPRQGGAGKAAISAANAQANMA